MNNQAFNSLRKEVSDLNLELLELLVKRGKAVEKLGDFKRSHSLPVFDPEREQQILEGLAHMEHTPYPLESIQSIYQAIFDASKDIQHLMRK